MIPAQIQPLYWHFTFLSHERWLNKTHVNWPAIWLPFHHKSITQCIPIYIGRHIGPLWSAYRTRTAYTAYILLMSACTWNAGTHLKCRPAPRLQHILFRIWWHSHQVRHQFARLYRQTRQHNYCFHSMALAGNTQFIFPQVFDASASLIHIYQMKI